MIRQSLLLAACALAPLVFTGCADDASGDKSAEAAPAAFASPAPEAEALAKDLAALASRIRMADATLERVVGDTATDPEDRLAAFNKSVVALGPTTATALGAKLKSAGAGIVAGWDASCNSASDAGLREVAAAGRDDAKARFAELDKALRGADASILYHNAILSSVQSALGSRPNSTQLAAARPSAARATQAGNKAIGWLNYAAGIAKKAGATPLPGAAGSADKTVPAETVPESPAAAPVAAPAPVSKPVEPAEPAEPTPAARPDPVPEPIDA